VTPGSQADPPVPQEPLPVPTAQEADPRVVVSTLRQTVPSAPRAPEAGMVLKPAVGQTVGVPVTPRILQLNFFFSLLAKIRALPFLFLFFPR
jgi:hypothetical protein